MTILEFNDVSRTFTQTGIPVPVLQNVNFSVAQNEFAAVMGPSGSGKSTLLNLAAGLLVPDSGEIYICGECLSAMNDDKRTVFRRRNLGIIFQDYNLIPTLTAEENIVLPVLLDGLRPDTAYLNELLERFGLNPRRKHYPHELSGGERQRVAIARALIIRPKLILADEPTGSLDILTGKKFCELLDAIHKTSGTSILLVSHDPVVSAHADSVSILAGGGIRTRFRSDGNPADISEHYISSIK